jgi:hypothetical protein
MPSVSTGDRCVRATLAALARPFGIGAMHAGSRDTVWQIVPEHHIDHEIAG